MLSDAPCGRAEGPPSSHTLWCRETATPAMLCDSVVASGRAQRLPPAHPLWYRENATPAMPWTTSADRDTTP
eukprot:1002901-Pyramimonas_sp.AAC.1